MAEYEVSIIKIGQQQYTRQIVKRGTIIKNVI